MGYPVPGRRDSRYGTWSCDRKSKIGPRHEIKIDYMYFDIITRPQNEDSNFFVIDVILTLYVVPYCPRIQYHPGASSTVRLLINGGSFW